MTLEDLLQPMSKVRLVALAASLKLVLTRHGSAPELRAEMASSLEEDVDALLEALTTQELRDVCRQQGLPIAGSKRELVDRVQAELIPNDDDGDSTEEEGEEEEEGERNYRQNEYRTEFDRDFNFDPEKAEVKAWSYQTEAVRELKRNLQRKAPALVHVATGGGKTRIANDYIAGNFRGGRSGWILWVTKDWALLEQAARDLSCRHDGWRSRLRRWGGEGRVLDPLEEGAGEAGTIVYTTLATLAQGNRLKITPRPSLVVWDECHWGANGRAARQLRRWGRDGTSRLLGLTATPRYDTKGHFKYTFSRSFETLIEEGYLARPITWTVPTNVSWAPLRSSSTGDVTASSLRELGENDRRNRLIAKQYRDHPDRYGKTIVFACNIDHAEKLKEIFRLQGIPTRVIHNERTREDRDDALEKYKESSGGVQVLVNVAMLTTGYDAPHTQSIFLARPTLSEVLYRQMVGRGARKNRETGKETFHLVDFTDSPNAFAEDFRRAPTISRPASSRSPRRQRFEFDPDGIPVSLAETSEMPEPLRGLWTRKGQTFGLEFEFTSDGFTSEMSHAAWQAVADPLRVALATALPGLVADQCIGNYTGFTGKDHSVWNVERDNSCGWEVTTRVLEGEAGMREVVDGLTALEAAALRLGLRVNHSTGTHLHLGWKGRNVTQVKRALTLVRLFEPALATLVSPSRIADFDPESNRYDITQPNRYCAPLAEVFPATRIARITSQHEVEQRVKPHENRFVTLNLRPMEDIGTMEVRMHNGTHDAGKILLWLSLWQQLFWAAENRNRTGAVPIVRDVTRITPEGDILDLAQTWLPWSSTTFRRRLDNRRREVSELWRHADLQPWLRFAQKWKRAPFAVDPSVVEEE